MSARRGQPGQAFASLTGRALVLLAVSLLVVAACATRPPSNVDDLCAIFRERPAWYTEALRSEKRWGTPVHVQMAIIRQESSFRFDARPPRRKLLGVVPWRRPSDAYGYAQVKDDTWAWYQEKTKRRGARRTDFGDAIDFVGWYTDLSRQQLGISKWDPYRQYLAYHEGHGGYERGTWRGKGWLQDVASRVDHRAKEWGAQLRRCEDGLARGGRWPLGAAADGFGASLSRPSSPG